MSACGFRVEVRIEFVRRHCAWDTFGWHLDLSAPKDRVQHNFSEVVVTPVLVKVAAGETEAAPAVRTLDRPHDVLGLTGVSLDFGVATMRIVKARLAARAVRWNSSQNGSHAFHGFGKSHVIVPVIANGKRFDAASDRMLRKFFEVSIPGGIDRPESLEISADPLQEFRAAFLVRHLNGVMRAAKTDAFLH